MNCPNPQGGRARSFLLLLFLACLACSRSKSTTDFHQIDGLNGTIHLNVPASWGELPELHASADIRVGSKEGDVYLLDVSEKKSILPKETLEDYSLFTREGLIKSLDFPQQLGPRRIKISGMSAIQYEIHAYSKSGGQRLIYLHTCVETPDYFHQIVGWTTAENFPSQEGVLKQVTNSFLEENSGDSSNPPK